MGTTRRRETKRPPDDERDNLSDRCGARARAPDIEWEPRACVAAAAAAGASAIDAAERGDRSAPARRHDVGRAEPRKRRAAVRAARLGEVVTAEWSERRLISFTRHALSLGQKMVTAERLTHRFVSHTTPRRLSVKNGYRVPR